MQTNNKLQTLNYMYLNYLIFMAITGLNGLKHKTWLNRQQDLPIMCLLSAIIHLLPEAGEPLLGQQ